MFSLARRINMYIVFRNYGKFTNKTGQTVEIVMVKDPWGYTDTFTDAKELEQFLKGKQWKNYVKEE
jgi:hypothetical protein